MLDWMRRLFGRPARQEKTDPALGRLLEIEPGGSKDFGPCECCGENSRTVWGYVSRAHSAEAVYYIHWSLGKVAETGASIDMILGQWGEGTEPKDRYMVSLLTYPGEGVMVVDATDRAIAHRTTAGRGLRRDEVIGTPLAVVVFQIIDAMWLQDRRIAEVTGNA